MIDDLDRVEEHDELQGVLRAIRLVSELPNLAPPPASRLSSFANRPHSLSRRRLQGFARATTSQSCVGTELPDTAACKRACAGNATRIPYEASLRSRFPQDLVEAFKTPPRTKGRASYGIAKRSPNSPRE